MSPNQRKPRGPFVAALKGLASYFRSDQRYLHSDVPMATTVSHGRYLDELVRLYNQPGMRVLEVGSREVTGESDARTRFARAEYIGFDIYAGPNVDVVGDAHRLASYFPGQLFDLVFSSAVFEHFAMPWRVAEETAKLLKVGGRVFVETHFSYSSHERPWHFFQFSDMALRALFNPALGFECEEAGVSNPIVGRFSSLAVPELRYHRVTGLYCHTEFLGRKARDVPDFNWSQVDLQAVVGASAYPPAQNSAPSTP